MAKISNVIVIVRVFPSTQLVGEACGCKLDLALIFGKRSNFPASKILHIFKVT